MNIPHMYYSMWGTSLHFRGSVCKAFSVLWGDIRNKFTLLPQTDINFQEKKLLRRKSLRYDNGHNGHQARQTDGGIVRRRSNCLCNLKEKTKFSCAFPQQKRRTGSASIISIGPPKDSITKHETNERAERGTFWSPYLWLSGWFGNCHHFFC